MPSFQSPAPCNDLLALVEKHSRASRVTSLHTRPNAAHGSPQAARHRSSVQGVRWSEVRAHRQESRSAGLLRSKSHHLELPSTFTWLLPHLPNSQLHLPRKVHASHHNPAG